MKTLPCLHGFPTLVLWIALGSGLSVAQSPSSGKTSDSTSGRAQAGAAPAKSPTESSATAPLKSDAWRPWFDGKTLAGWIVTDFAGKGEVEVKDGQIVLRSGLMLTGVNRTNTVPKTNYELALEAMKVEGGDFFCGLTFPVGDAHCSFIVGGWGGGVVGISSIDGMDASENETTKFMNFEKDRWYRIRVRVTPAKIEAWIDDEKLVDQSIEGRRISMRPGEIELSVPFGVATYQTTGALRNIRIRSVSSR